VKIIRDDITGRINWDDTAQDIVVSGSIMIITAALAIKAVCWVVFW
jgi:hypothetical protein